MNTVDPSAGADSSISYRITTRQKNVCRNRRHNQSAENPPHSYIQMHTGTLRLYQLDEMTGIIKFLLSRLRMNNRVGLIKQIWTGTSQETLHIQISVTTKSCLF